MNTTAPQFHFDPDYGSVSNQMKEVDRWLAFRLLWNPATEHFDKTPVNSRGQVANDHQGGESFETMLEYTKQNPGTVLGFNIRPPFIAIDVDDCVDLDKQEVTEWAAAISRESGSYQELSVSGTGIHIIGLGTKPGSKSKNGSVEIYTNKRALALSGQTLDISSELCPIDVTNTYNKMVNREYVFGESTEEKITNERASSDVPSQIHHTGKAITNLLTLLSRGDYTADSKPFRVTDEFENWVEYPSQSECIAALLVCLAHKYDCDPDLMEQAFEDSHLSDIPKWANGKWDRLKHDEIKSAIAKIKKTATSSATAPAIQTENKSADWRTQFVTIGQLEPGGAKMLVEGFLPEGVSMLGALPGVGKTWFALSLAKALTTGEKFLGRFEVTATVPVLYLIPESSGGAFRARAEKFRIPNDPNLFLCRTVSQGATLLISDPAVLAAVKELKPVIILDTAIRFNRGNDENSANSNKLFVDDSLNLIAAGARAVFGLHHSTKASRKEALTQENALRGTGDLAAMADCIYGLRRNDGLYDNGNGPLELEVTCLKPREFKPPLPFTIAASTKTKEGIVSCIDADGDFKIIASCDVTADLQTRFVAAITELPQASMEDVAEVIGASKVQVQRVANQLGYKKARNQRWELFRLKAEQPEKKTKAIEVTSKELSNGHSQ